MAADITRHMEHGSPLPVSVINALEAGLTAMKIDESRRSGGVVDMADIWARFDELTAGGTTREAASDMP